jgi:hypothetical protein
MGHAARQAHLAPEALRRVVRPAGEELESDPVPDFLVERRPDGAGRAATEQPFDAVALGEQLPRLWLVAQRRTGSTSEGETRSDTS